MSTSQPQPRGTRPTLRYPHLTLGDAIGLDERETTALGQAADGLRREGRLEDALSVWGVLIACDPYRPRPWREVAQLQQRLGQHVHAVAAFEMLARVADREAKPTYREALSCNALGQRSAARELLEHALTLCDDTKQPWVAHARRSLENAR